MHRAPIQEKAGNLVSAPCVSRNSRRNPGAGRWGQNYTLPVTLPSESLTLELLPSWFFPLQLPSSLHSLGLYRRPSSKVSRVPPTQAVLSSSCLFNGKAFFPPHSQRLHHRTEQTITRDEILAVAVPRMHQTFPALGISHRLWISLSVPAFPAPRTAPSLSFSPP